MEELLIDDVKLRVGDEDEDVFTHYGNKDCAQGYLDNQPVYASLPSNGFNECRDSESSEAETDGIFPRVRSTSQSSDNDAVKPLMYPRQRIKTKSYAEKKRFCHLIVRPVLYCLILVGSLVAFALVIVRIVSDYSVKMTPGQHNKSKHIVGCSHLEVEDVWVTGLPKLMTESAFRLLDVNHDGDLDILFGFATGAEGYNVPSIVCDIYFSGHKPCLGGLLAVDGRSGRELWRHYSQHEIFAVSCEEDLTGDGQPDCIIAGRVGNFEAVDTSTGAMLWNFTHSSEHVDIMNLYTGQFIGDIDGDGIADILNIHGGDPFGEPGSATRLSGKLLVFSGRDGSVIQSVGVPDNRESYYSPVVYRQSDGTQVVLFGTGGETHPGALWFITLNDLIKGDIRKARKIYNNPYKGIMTPPVLLDLTKDGVKDIVMATYNSSVIAFDGETFAELWNSTYKSSETYATPAPGYFNDDDTPDFMIHWQYGPGFPVYYHAVTTVVDGTNGKPLVTPFIKSSVGAQTSPLTVSMEGHGNDLFLYWLADCVGHEGQGGQYDFVKGTNVHEKSRSDVCRLRFRSEGFSRLYGLSQHLKTPGFILYDSQERKEVEHSAWINSSAEAEEFLQSHPSHEENYMRWKAWVASNQQQADEIMGNGASSWEEDDSREVDNSLDDSLWDYVADDNFQPEFSVDSRYPTPVKDTAQPLKNRPLFGSTKYGDAKYGDTKNGGPKYGDPKYGDTKYGDTKYGNAKYGDTKYSDTKNGDMRVNDAYRTLGNILHTQELDPHLYRQVSSLLNNYYSPDAKPERYQKDPPSSHQTPSQWYEGRRKPIFRDELNTWKDPSDPDDGGYRKAPYDGQEWWRKGGRRQRRHVGIHDEGGLQRLISTGTLAPNLLQPSDPAYNHSIDVIFATYWFYPAKTKALLPKDQQCIDEKLALQNIRFDPNSKYYGMDDDGYEHAVTDECLEDSQHQLAEHGIYTSQNAYNPYSLNMGQLTLYRLRLKCSCPDLAPQDTCSRILPYDQQQWPAYMGGHADSHWITRNT